MFMPMACWTGMKDDADTLLDHMSKLLELAELARHAAPEDRARLERTIKLAGRAILAVAQAQEAVQRATGPLWEAENNAAQRWSDLEALLTELRIMRRDDPK
jgi:hypothetical protein